MKPDWKKFTRDRLVASPNWYFGDWGLFAYSFKHSANLVYAEYKRTRREAFWFPAIFLYRQWLELALKSLWSEIKKFDKSFGAVPRTHLYSKLWPPIRKWTLKKEFVSENDEMFLRAERIFSFIDEIDPSATAFRYPPMKLPHRDLINFSLEDFEQAIDEIDTVFFALRAMIDRYEDMLVERRSIAADERARNSVRS
jgi:hypothetical protein